MVSLVSMCSRLSYQSIISELLTETADSGLDSVFAAAKCFCHLVVWNSVKEHVCKFSALWLEITYHSPDFSFLLLLDDLSVGRCRIIGRTLVVISVLRESAASATTLAGLTGAVKDRVSTDAIYPTLEVASRSE